MTITNAAQPATVVRRGNGTATHRAVISGGRTIGTACAMDTLLGGRQSLRLTAMPEGTPVTCKTCNRDVATPAAPAAPAPERCPQHAAGTVYSVRVIKAGTKTTWTCGCSHLER